MKISPIIPIWIMGIICIALLISIILKRKSQFKNLIKKDFRKILIIILLFCVNLRFQVITNESNMQVTDLDILFVIDNTISMQAEDYNGSNTRMSAVQSDCEYIINKFTGSRFSVIKFDNTSQILMPYTTDTSMAISSINALSPVARIYATGTSLGLSIDDMENQLSSSDSDRRKIVFYISDGEITNDEELESFSSLAELIDNGAVLGYGTTSGGMMKAKESLYADNEVTNYIDDTTEWTTNGYEKAVSKIDETNLKSIASDLKIDYIHMEKQSNIDEKLDEIISESKSNIDLTDTDSYKDIYIIFVLPLLILLVFEFVSYKKNL